MQPAGWLAAGKQLAEQAAILDGIIDGGLNGRGCKQGFARATHLMHLAEF